VLSEVLGFDFMDRVRSLDSSDPYHYLKGATVLHINWDDFRKLFELRDDIAHEMKDSGLTTIQAISLADNAMNFLDAASCICHPNFDPTARTVRV
jgi:hypothetical protein